MVTIGVFPFQGKTHMMVEPGIEPGTSWLVVRSSDHQATGLVTFVTMCNIFFGRKPDLADFFRCAVDWISDQW